MLTAQEYKIVLHMDNFNSVMNNSLLSLRVQQKVFLTSDEQKIACSCSEFPLEATIAVQLSLREDLYCEGPRRYSRHPKHQKYASVAASFTLESKH